MQFFQEQGYLPPIIKPSNPETAISTPDLSSFFFEISTDSIVSSLETIHGAHIADLRDDAVSEEGESDESTQ